MPADRTDEDIAREIAWSANVAGERFVDRHAERRRLANDIVAALATAGAEGEAAEREACATDKRKRGSVEILCDEIGFTFTPGMGNARLLVAFVRRLVLEVAEMRWVAEEIAKVTGRGAPSEGSSELLDKVLDMLNGNDIAVMVEQCAGLHDLADTLNPEDAYPTDHLIDMLSSCISAIRFGCDPGRWGIGSRHAAAAAQDVWQRRYGVTLHDRLSARWEKDWARHKLQEALVGLAFPPTVGADECARSAPREGEG